MLMGGKTPPDEAHRMLDRYVEAGGNFLDTADVYGDGESERTLAPWLASRRDEVVVATKVRMKVSDPPGEGLAPDRIRAACDASLKRLGIDVIDLYQVHAPDPETPLEETLEALDGLVRAGKVRAIGASNYPAWLLAWAVALQDRNGWAPFVSLQPQYSLVERSIEVEILPFCRAAGIGADPVGPARRRLPDRQVLARHRPAGGLADGRGGRRHRGGAPPARDRAQLPRRRRGAGDRGRESGATISQVALAWLLGVPGVVAPIVGPRTFEQMEDLLGAADLTLTEDERAAAGLPRPAAGDVPPADAARAGRPRRARAAAAMSDNVVDRALARAPVEEAYGPASSRCLNDYKLARGQAAASSSGTGHRGHGGLLPRARGRLTIQLRDGDVELGPGALRRPARRRALPARRRRRPTCS